MHAGESTEKLYNKVSNTNYYNIQPAPSHSQMQRLFLCNGKEERSVSLKYYFSFSKKFYQT